MKKDYATIVFAYLVAALAAYLVGKRLVGWHPLLAVAVADQVGTAVIFGFSMVCDNSSVYDAYWSVVPPLIVVYWLISTTSLFGGLRQVVVLILVLVWSIRLTLNWAVRWQGMRYEDWRYADMRKNYGKVYWLVSFFGIHLVPTLLVFLGCLPFFPCFSMPRNAFGVLDGIAVLVTAGAIWIEWRADLDVTRFTKLREDKEALLQSGIWSLSRHPNYLGEISFWWGIYLFGVAANGKYWWTIIGPLFTTLLFLFISIPMIEKRMVAHKPAYERYKQTTPMLVPWLGVKKDS